MESKRRFKRILILGILLFQLCFIQAQTSKTFFVSPNGSDNGEGTIGSPFETLGKALSEVKKEAVNATDKTDFQVYLREGTYYFTQGENLSNLADKGKISLSSYKDEKIVFHGGEKVKGSAFKLCKDKKILERLLPEARGKVWEANLKKEGITNYGTMKQHGFGTTPEPTPMEFFINGEPQRLARYPNEGILQIGKVFDKGSIPRRGDFSGRGGEFGFEYERVERWKNANEIWLHGKFSNGYNDDHLKVESTDWEKKSFKITQAHLYGLQSSIYDRNGELMKSPSPFRGYYAYNLLEEIDQPGEYFLDRKTDKIYIYPSNDLLEANIEVSINEDPFLEIVNASNIEISDITFTCSRGLALYLSDCRNVTIDRCTFSNLGTVGISMGQKFRYNQKKYYADGSPNLEECNGIFENITISNCIIFNTGTGGVLLNGGDRENLIAGNNMIYNTEFFKTDRVNNSYSPSIRINGVGNEVRNCYFHDLKHQAIGFSGNDHLIEYCRFDHVCTDADDMGAIYTGRNPSARGTIIRKNYFSNIQPQKEEISMCGVYFDDGSGGMTVQDNLFYKVGNPGHYQNFAAVFMHGGHDNKIMSNVFIDCPVAVGQSPWDDNRWAKFLESELMKNRLCKEVNIATEIYQNKYPELKDFFTKIGGRTNYVGGNMLIRSLIARNGDFILRKNITDNNAGDSPENISFDGVKKILPSAGILPLDQYGIVNTGTEKTQAKEFHMREGLPNFFNKAEKGDSVKIAYLGGSITAQQGWRIFSMEWFKQQFPKAKFSEVNAAIGGTGSLFGVFRLQDHVLNYRPDMVFIEFAVNDAGQQKEKTIRTMEGIVRQIWEANPKTDICFVYTIKNDFVKTEQAGGLPVSKEAMEEVANRYGIPTINFGCEVVSQINENELIISGKNQEIEGVKVFSPDGIHPYPEVGHKIYQIVLARSFEKMMDEGKSSTKIHKLGIPIAADYFKQTQMLDYKKAKLTGNWEIIIVKDNPGFSGFGKYLKEFGKVGETGAVLEFKFNGRAIGAYDIMGPDAGRVIVKIDGETVGTKSRFDKHCTYRRISYFFVDHLDDKEHTVVFEVNAEPFDKESILAERGITMRNPEKYDEYNWYVGKILVDGEFIEP